jgi:putative heme iron utilization protein
MSADTLSNAELARGLMREVRSASLGTLDDTGAPFASYVVAAPADDLSPLLLLSRLAVHTRNLERDARASLLLVREPAAEEEAMTALRLTLSGRVLRDDDPESRRFYLARHSEASRYAGFADFSLYRFQVAAGHLVAGFGRIVTLSAAELLDSSFAG